MAAIQTINRKNGKRYRVQVMRNGRRVGKVFDKKKDAEIFLSQLTINDDFANSLTHSALTQLTLNDACIEYLNQYKGKDQSQAQRLRHWQNEFGEKPVGKVTKFDIRKTLKSLSLNNYAPATVNRYKSSISAVFSYLAEEYDTDHNPAREVKQLKEDNARTRFLTDAEISKLLHSAKKSKWDRLYLLILLALTTGARRTEMLSLKWSDIDFLNRSASLDITKNGQARILPLTLEVVDELMKFRQVGSGYVFPHKSHLNKYYRNFDKHWQACLKTASINDFRFHDLRHSAASLLAKSGASLLEISEVLGHKSITMTQRYAHLCIKHKASLIDNVMGRIGNEL
ncbi:tyrosine-type recombinase/integrase [Thalassotalea crassostreae]|uniref:tyrosine-type recombinase/integrase n=1 Tax=Thalassotalea crassostreae TaxID=1763536 RepID=UPI000839977F|nr:site-specific integrase [Thalassotalea crassostreae]